MPSEGSVTYWIDQLKAGDHDAAEELWQRYFHRLVDLARVKLRHTNKRMADEEDVALSAFDSFCRGAEQGRFPNLADRDNLWGLLVTLTTRKAAHQIRDAQRQKRGGGAVQGESALMDAASSTDGGLHQIASREPTPAFAAEVAEEFRRLLARLNDPELESLALCKMEGWTNEEIASKLGCVPRTVERKLRLIREIWEGETP